ncbi:hypothetical protein EI77_02494 [Prosthecobacter fusiformis]|uniref:Uncharacterized protein n=1 Tax=Prosthecobacter fusiformis TaxID=48464 RepID=A0A4R7RZH6_9BACT|nr:hypothetical protein [Prosthecobacter fusiformis]TDU71370.1 hypothetical protein EI77_02494 [Prosthecobacter fusiformis]
MSAAPSNSETVIDAPPVWDEETIRTLNRHMRIRFRYLSSAVRQMTLLQCMDEVSPSRGVNALIEQVEKKLSL